MCFRRSDGCFDRLPHAKQTRSLAECFLDNFATSASRSAMHSIPTSNNDIENGWKRNNLKITISWKQNLQPTKLTGKNLRISARKTRLEKDGFWMAFLPQKVFRFLAFLDDICWTSTWRRTAEFLWDENPQIRQTFLPFRTSDSTRCWSTRSSIPRSPSKT